MLFSVAVLVCATCPPSQALAQEWSRRSHALGEMAGAPAVLVVRTRVSAGEYYETRWTVVTDTESGPRRFVLKSQMDTAPAQAHRVTPLGGGFVVRYPCGNRFAPMHQVCTERWELTDPPRRRARSTSSPWSRAVARIERLLRAGRFDEARRLATRTDTMPNAHHDWGHQIYRQFLEAAVTHGIRDAQRGQAGRAAARIRSLLRAPPVESRPEDHTPPGLLWCRGADPNARPNVDCPPSRQVGLPDSAESRALLLRLSGLLGLADTAADRAVADQLHRALDPAAGPKRTYLLHAGHLITVAARVIAIFDPRGELVAENARIIRGMDDSGTCPSDGFGTVSVRGSSFTIHQQNCGGWQVISEQITFVQSHRGGRFLLDRIDLQSFDRSDPDLVIPPRSHRRSELGALDFESVDLDLVVRRLQGSAP